MIRRQGESMEPHCVRNAPGLDLHIDELVLHGFDHVDRWELAAAVERALAHLFAERGAPASLNQGGTRASLDGGVFAVPRGAGAQEIGGQIALAVYRSLGS